MPMKDRDVSSSDIECAREISRRLSAFGAKTDSPADAPAAVTEYVRFSNAPSRTERNAKATVTVLEKEPPANAPEIEPFPPLPRDTGSWEALLAWTADRFEAESAFIVDNQGFVIANRGKIPSDGFEALGAEVYLAFEQLERLDPLAGRLLWLDLEFTRRRISALRAKVPNREQMVFVAVNSSSAHIPHRAKIENSILDTMTKLS